MHYAEFIAIDASGSVWVMSTDLNFFLVNGTLTKLSSSGAVLSGAVGYTGSTVGSPYGLAVDDSGNAWTENGVNGIDEYSNSGTLLSPSEGYTGGLNYPSLIAIDGSGNPWVTWSNGSAMVSEFSGSGTPLAAYTSFSAAGSIDAGASSI